MLVADKYSLETMGSNYEKTVLSRYNRAMKNKGSIIKLVLLSLVSALIIGQASIELFKIIQNYQEKLGRLFIVGAAAIGVFILGCIVLFLIALELIWQPKSLQPLMARFISLRGRLKNYRWLVALVILLTPLLLLQNTIAGTYLTGTAFRLVILLGQA